MKLSARNISTATEAASRKAHLSFITHMAYDTTLSRITAILASFFIMCRWYRMRIHRARKLGGFHGIPFNDVITIIPGKGAVTMKCLATVSMVLGLVLFMLSSTAMAAEVNLSVAASMKDVVNALTDNYSKNNPGVKFLKNYAASGALAKQIDNGAPADIYISANVKWMDYLKGKKLMDDKSIGTFAYNELVFVGKPSLKVSSMQDLAKLGKIAIGSPKSVPAGEYAMTALKNAGVDRELENKLVMAKDVRECLIYAERGEVEGSFVYKTDALLASKNVKILFTVPHNLYPRVTYPMGLTSTGRKNVAADAFYRFLHSAEAKSVLLQYGFAVK
jgi:molybdate transport system substrate-binding protein